MHSMLLHGFDEIETVARTADRLKNGGDCCVVGAAALE